MFPDLGDYRFHLNYPEIDEHFLDLKTQISVLCKDLLKKDFTRGDYKELVLLVLLYLQDDEGNAEAFKTFCRPGALYKAISMSKLLYSVKMELLRDHIITKLPKGSVFGAGQAHKIERFVKFVVFCYVAWWLTAPVPANAPVNDLALLKVLYKYIDVDEICGTAAFKAFMRHLWYLAEENVLLALFCSIVSEGEKEPHLRLDSASPNE